jgi:D-alanyl-D-alanine carboxypeptidase
MQNELTHWQLERRGEMTFRSFTADFGGRQVRVTTHEEPDGKLEQYLVIAPGSQG